MLVGLDKLVGMEDRNGFAYHFKFYPETNGEGFVISRGVVLREFFSFLTSRGKEVKRDSTDFYPIARQGYFPCSKMRVINYDPSLRDTLDLFEGRNQVIWNEEGVTINRFDDEEVNREDLSSVPIGSIARIFAIAYTVNRKSYYGVN